MASPDNLAATRPRTTLLRRLASVLRKQFTARQARYLFGTLLLARMAWLRRRYSVYPDNGLLPEFDAGQRSQETLVSVIDLSDMDPDYLAWYQARPGLPPLRDGRVELRLDFQARTLDDCEILPRRRAILHRPSERIVLCPGHRGDRNSVQPFRCRATESVPGLSISMLAGAHYAHFLLDQLTLLLHILTVVPAARAATILVSDGMPGFQQAGYAIIRQAYPGLGWKTVPADTKVACERLVVACHDRAGHVLNWFASAPLLLRLGQGYREQYGIRPGSPDRLILVSRRHQKLRQLDNEDELFARLAPLGFELVAPELLPHAEQVALFTSARMVIGGSGSALINLMFCQPGGTLIELCPASFYKPFWLGLSRQLGLRHHVLISEEYGLYDRFTVDPDRVLELVRATLAESRQTGSPTR